MAWKYFTEVFLFLLYVRKDQAQEQSGCELWFRKEAEEWLFTLTFSIQFLGQNFICNIYVAYFGFYQLCWASLALPHFLL